MARACTVCAHPSREAIDLAVVGRRDSIRAISRQFSVTKDALARHAGAHLAETLVKATGAAEAAHGDDLLGRVRSLVADARRLQATAEKAGDVRTALGAIREQTRIVELMARLLGEIQTGSTVTVNVGAPVQELGADQLEHLAALALDEARELRAGATVTTTGHALEPGFPVETTRALDPGFQGAATTETTSTGAAPGTTGAERDG